MTAPETTPSKRRRGRPSHEEGAAIALIRRAALREFALAGFAGVSIADIAQAAGVAVDPLSLCIQGCLVGSRRQ